MPEIIKHGRVIRPGIGISIANENITHRLGVKGVLIVKVLPGSNAAAVGLRGIRQRGNEIVLGDIILSIGGTEVFTYDEMRNELDRHRVGDEVELEIARGSKKIRLRIKLEEVA